MKNLKVTGQNKNYFVKSIVLTAIPTTTIIITIIIIIIIIVIKVKNSILETCFFKQ